MGFSADPAGREPKPKRALEATLEAEAKVRSERRAAPAQRAATGGVPGGSGGLGAFGGAGGGPGLAPQSCPADHFVTGLSAAGELECSPVGTAAYDAVNAGCSVYLGWRDSCDGLYVDASTLGQRERHRAAKMASAPRTPARSQALAARPWISSASTPAAT